MWWEDGNTLALIDAIRKFAQKQDGGFSGEHNSIMNSHLIGTARALGMSEEAIQDAFASDRMLTIYEP